MLTYEQWNRTVNKAAHAFRAGHRQGDRVAFTYNLLEQVTGLRVDEDRRHPGADQLLPRPMA
jgi:hypothetical protein